MTLKEYLEKNKISIENAAKDLGFSYEDTRRYCHKIVIPRVERVKKIFEWSGGLVTANDFYFSDENGSERDE